MSQRRLQFTLSAWAMALAPSTPMEFPLRLQTKAGVRRDSPGWLQTGAGGEVTTHSESRDRQARPGDHHDRVGAVLSQGPGSQTPQGSVAQPWTLDGPTEHLLQDLQALVDYQSFCQGLGTSCMD